MTIIKAIFYMLMGIFYRKDLRRIYYTDSSITKGYTIIDLPNKGLISHNTCKQAIKEFDFKDSTLKDRLNYDRLRFGLTVYPYHSMLSVINWTFLNTYFYDDVHIGHKLEKANISGYEKYHHNKLLQWLHDKTDYSNQIYISRKDLENIPTNG